MNNFERYYVGSRKTNCNFSIFCRKNLVFDEFIFCNSSVVGHVYGCFKDIFRNILKQNSLLVSCSALETNELLKQQYA